MSLCLALSSNSFADSPLKGGLADNLIDLSEEEEEEFSPVPLASLPNISQRFPSSSDTLFVIEKFQLEGLQFNSESNVLSYLPLKVGDSLTLQDTHTLISTLFKTGLFKDIRLERAGNTLIIHLAEHPVISELHFVGNDDLETDTLRKALKGIGFAEGRVYNQSVLERVKLELQRQYFNLGKYAVQLDANVVPLDDQRVKITLTISEGVVAKIRQINIVGNHTIPTSKLLAEMQLSIGGWFSWFSSRDQYSQMKLAADIETLRSYYWDHGYLNFSLDSTQVSITPDKKDVYITLNLTEGRQYTVDKLEITGNLVVNAEELRSKITLKPGQLFSRKAVSSSVEALIERIGDEGYAFANINPVPTPHEETGNVDLNFFIDPGKRVYVRKIQFKGNTKTRDEVLRREMRQLEGAWLSTKNLKRSRERLERLNYFEEVQVETPLVEGSQDQVDVNFSIVESPSGNILAGVGYSQTQGLLLNASIIQDNFLGSGKRLGATFDNSQVNTVYNFSYFNPYVTIDGLSRGFNVFYRTTDAEEANLSRYNTDAYGANLTYGIPITEFSYIRLGGDFDHTKLKTTLGSAQEVYDFIREEGEVYDTYRLTGNWTFDTRNRSLLPDRGWLSSFNTEIALPGGDLLYYKTRYRQQWLYSLIEDYVLSLEGELAYANSYGKTKRLPFFENYTAGGPRTVRGFRENTLGPLDSNRRPLGGNMRIIGNAELILPLPFVEKAKSLRVSAFLDVGNVYAVDEEFDFNELRYSTGLSTIWISPIGILTFSLAKPLNPKEGDQQQSFQFSIGTNF